MELENRTTYLTDNYVIFDLETTGISCTRDAIIEISAIRVRNKKPCAEFSTLVNPGFPIPYAASCVNHITDDMVQGSPDIATALKNFLDFIGEDVLVGHNIQNFDMKFIRRDARILWNYEINNKSIDTLTLARNSLPQQRTHKLIDLAAHYQISSYGAHRALNDCRMNQQVYEFLKKEQVILAENGLICPRCGSPLKQRNGRFGQFLGCTSYPDCRYTRNI